MPEEKQLSIVRCPACGEFLPKGTVALRFHDSACRARFFRWMRDIEFHSQLIQQYLAQWEAVASCGQEVGRISIQIQDIQKTIADLIVRVNAANAERVPQL